MPNHTGVGPVRPDGSLLPPDATALLVDPAPPALLADDGVRGRRNDEIGDLVELSDRTAPSRPAPGPGDRARVSAADDRSAGIA